jgi:hypothetical protein
VNVCIIADVSARVRENQKAVLLVSGNACWLSVKLQL